MNEVENINDYNMDMQKQEGGIKVKKILICIISIFVLCSCNSTTKLNDTSKENEVTEVIKAADINNDVKVNNTNNVKEINKVKEEAKVIETDDTTKVNEVNEEIKAPEIKGEAKVIDTNKVNNIEKNQGNLLNQGFVVSDDDYIYYTNLYEDNNIYKKTKADSEEIILTDDQGLYMNIVNNWLYYVRQNDGKIYKIKTDGTDKKCIGGQNVLYLNVIGNDIYYSNKVGLYKLNEEEEVKEILKGSIASINIVDDNIFYINLDDSKIYSMKIDGTNNKVINEKEAIGLQIVDGW